MHYYPMTPNFMKTKQAHTISYLKKPYIGGFLLHRRHGSQFWTTCSLTKAKALHGVMKGNDLESMKDCGYTNRWLDGFKKRHGIK